MIGAPAAVVLTSRAHLGVITASGRVLPGVLLTWAIVLLLFVCNGKRAVSRWFNRPWISVVGVVILGVLVGLSAIVTITVLVPTLDGVVVSECVMATIAVGSLWRRYSPVIAHTDQCALWELTAGAIAPPRHGPLSLRSPLVIQHLQLTSSQTGARPPLAESAHPVASTVRAVGLVALRAYLVLAVILLLMQSVELAALH
jgi:hypothetical protein